MAERNAGGRYYEPVSYTHLDVYKRQVERFWDNTRWMIEFFVLRPSTAYGSPGEEMRLFLTEDGYQAALQSQQRREIKIKRYARVIEGHILDFKPGKRRRS